MRSGRRHGPARIGRRHFFEPLEDRRLLAASDFGDASASYPVLLEDGGAWHELTVGGPRLGVTVDGENEGQPSPDALADDIEFDGENGVAFLTPTASRAAPDRVGPRW